MSEAVLQSFLSLMLQGVSELCPEQAKLKETPGSRHFHQYQIFVRMVHEEYAHEHQVVYYAKKMKMLIMDAKTQLRTENAPVKDIALSLGFNNAAFFNKFFKRHTGVTPQMFRNSVR